MNRAIASERKLELLWETNANLEKPESAVWDAVRERIYVSNINGAFLAKDGNGFLSTIRPDGSYMETRWSKQRLDNPQGLALWEGRLFVADIDKVVSLAADSGSIVESYEVPGARFLNDVAVDESGDV